MKKATQRVIVGMLFVAILFILLAITMAIHSPNQQNQIVVPTSTAVKLVTKSSVTGEGYLSKISNRFELGDNMYMYTLELYLTSDDFQIDDSIIVMKE